MHNLLTEPLIRARRAKDGATEAAPLPAVLAALMRDEITAFPVLRPHQRHAWHAFLAQLGAIALHSASLTEPPEDEARWRDLLRALTPEFADDAPWRLVVADPTKPAFLQPPAPEGELSAYRNRITAADQLDVLVTAKNFDIKQATATDAEPDDWLFALIDLQTMEGYLGAGNYGIVRMNGGFSARSFLGLAPVDDGPGVHLRRDILAMLAARDETAQGSHGYPAEGGAALLWLLPWDGTDSLSLDQLDPYFIEICRRVRLAQEGGRLYAVAAGSKAARIAGKEAKGNLGDPWAPVHLSEAKSLTLSDQDWTHELLFRLLFKSPPEWAVPPLAERQARDASGPMLLVAEAFARGNSKTDGFKSRVVPVPVAMVRELFGERPKAIAPGLLADIASVDLALRNGLVIVAAGGVREKVKSEHYSRSLHARKALKRQADMMFFPELWTRMAATSDAGLTPIRRTFLERLARIAREEFARALPAIPCASLMRPRAEARGRQALEYGLARAMPEKAAEETHVEA